MIDPYFYEHFDPDYLLGDEDDDCSEPDPMVPPIVGEDDDDWPIDGTEMGMVGALADELAGDSNKYDLNENTDRENWEKAMKFISLSSRHKPKRNLPPFEQYVEEYIRRGFRHPDD